MIILDTNVISEVFKPAPDERVMAWLRALNDDVAITTITLAELLAGIRRLPEGRRKTELGKRVHATIQAYRDVGAILPFDADAAEQFAEILVERDRLGRPILMADAQIAAICRVHHAECATRNTSDFDHVGLTLIDPWSFTPPDD